MRHSHCKYCGKLFSAVRSTKEFCNTNCRVKYHNRKKSANIQLDFEHLKQSQLSKIDLSNPISIRLIGKEVSEVENLANALSLLMFPNVKVSAIRKSKRKKYDGDFVCYLTVEKP